MSTSDDGEGVFEASRLFFSESNESSAHGTEPPEKEIAESENEITEQEVPIPNSIIEVAPTHHEPPKKRNKFKLAGDFISETVKDPVLMRDLRQIRAPAKSIGSSLFISWLYIDVLIMALFFACDCMFPGPNLLRYFIYFMAIIAVFFVVTYCLYICYYIIKIIRNYRQRPQK